MSCLLDYPNAPGFKAPGPSEQAAKAVEGMAKTLREKVRNVPLPPIRHAITRSGNREAASILGAIVDRLAADAAEMASNSATSEGGLS